MKGRDAIEKAGEWVTAHAGDIEGLQGAFLTGSVIWLSDEDDLPPWSDVDIKIVLESPASSFGWGKRRVDGLLLDISLITAEGLSDPDAVLGHFQLAPAFRKDTILADPDGRLAKLRDYVAPRFRDRDQIIRRAEGVRALTEARLDHLPNWTELHDLVTGFLFAAGGNAHLILTFACRNPTVRRRYADSAELLAAIGKADIQDRLLATSGFADLSEKQAQDHLAHLADGFDIAANALTSPYQFAADMTEAARPVAIDGAAEMIAAGFHREAVYWIAAMMCRCRAVIAMDAAEQLDAFDQGFHHLLQDLSLPDRDIILGHADQIRADRDAIWAMLPDMITAFDGLDE